MFGNETIFFIQINLLKELFSMFKGRMYILDRYQDDLAVLLEFPSKSNVLVVPTSDFKQGVNIGDVLLVEIKEEGFNITKVSKHVANKQKLAIENSHLPKIDSYYIDYEHGCLVYTTAS